MPDACCVADCPNVGTHGGVIRYFSLPQVIENKGEEVKRLSSLQRDKWVARVREMKPDWEPQNHSRICSFHFVSGNKASLTDSTNPDWVPSLFMGKEKEDKQKKNSETLTLIKGLVASKKKEIYGPMMPITDKPIAVYMLGATHRRWKEVKGALSLMNDDALANYLLNLYEAVLPDNPKTSHLAKAIISANTHQTKINLRSEPPENADTETSVLQRASSSPRVVSTECEEAAPLLMTSLPPDIAVVSDCTKSQDATEDETSNCATDTMETATDTLETATVTLETDQPGDTYNITQKERTELINASHAIQSQCEGNVEQSDSNLSVSETDDVAETETEPAIFVSDIAAVLDSNNALSPAETAPQIKINKSYLAKRNNQTVTVSNHLLKSLSYQCNRCHKKFSDPRLLEMHKLELHGAVDKYQCRHCCITYKNRRGLTQHMGRDHPGPANKPYLCSACDQSFKNRDDMIKHQKVHSEACNKQCKFCPRTFVDAKKWRKHQKECHVRNEDGTVVHTGLLCKKCGSVYKTLNALSTHETQHCKGWNGLLNSKLSCPQCGRRFDNSKILVKHLRDIHSEEIKLGTMNFGETNGNGISIGANGKILVSKNASIVQKCVQRRKCPQCEKTFKHNISLRQHIEVAHSEKPPEYKCKSCHRVYSRIHNLRAHEKIHREGQPHYKCRYCPKAYKSKQCMLEHEMKHEGVLSLCSICGKGFATPTTLNTHMRVHKNVKKYQCSYCNKKFYDGYTMRCHVNSHTGNQTLKCKYCNKSFVFASSRSLHQRTQHAAQYYADRAVLEVANEICESTVAGVQEEGETQGDALGYPIVQEETSHSGNQGDSEEYPIVLELQRLSKELEKDGVVNVTEFEQLK